MKTLFYTLVFFFFTINIFGQIAHVCDGPILANVSNTYSIVAPSDNVYIMGGVSNSSTMSAGTLYDSGGAFGNYSNSESLTFTLNIASYDFIELIIEYDTQLPQDLLTIVDNGVTVGNFTGIGTDTITTFDSSIDISFTSDTNTVSSGFKIEWRGVSVNLTGTTAYPEIYEPGVKLMWDPSKAAFRLGMAINNNNIGFYSTAWGANNTASSDYSTAWGNQNEASGDYSTAWGNQNEASGDRATAWGNENNATGFNSTAWGNQNEASSDNSTAWGNQNEASDSYSTAWGSQNKALGIGSTVWGFTSEASGDLSTVWGWESKASGFLSTAWGVGAEASGYLSTAWGGGDALGDYSTAWGAGDALGDYSTAFGRSVANAYLETVLGRYNSSGGLSGDQTNWVSTQRLFVVGNGTSSLGNNAFVIYKDGDGFLEGSLSQSSDRTLKEKIKPIKNAQSLLSQLNGYTYYWKDKEQRDSNKQVGVIAQEVQKVLPELVRTDENDHLSVNYIGLIPILIEANNEQQGEITELKVENEELRVLGDELFIKNEEQEQEILELKNRLSKIEAFLSQNGSFKTETPTQSIHLSPTLKQNTPNPFYHKTQIECFVPKTTKNAIIQITDVEGKVVKVVEIENRGEVVINISGKSLEQGTYFYSLVVDEEVVDTKQMILTK